MIDKNSKDELEIESEPAIADRLHRNVQVATQQPAPPQKDYKFRVVVSFWTHFLCWVRMFCLCCCLLWFVLGYLGGPLFERYLGHLQWNTRIVEPWMIIHLLWVYLPLSIGWIWCSFETRSNKEKRTTTTQPTSIDSIQNHKLTKDSSKLIQEQEESQKKYRRVEEATNIPACS